MNARIQGSLPDGLTDAEMAGQLCRADAVLQSVTEPDMRVSDANDVDAVWIGERRRVLVGGPGVEQHEIACPSRDAIDVDVLPRVTKNANSAGHADAQQLFDRPGESGRIALQHPPLIAIGQQLHGVQPGLHHPAAEVFACGYTRHAVDVFILGGGPVESLDIYYRV